MLSPRRRPALPVVLAALVLAAPAALPVRTPAAPVAPAAAKPASQPARNVIFLIGDGMGPAYVTLARGVADRPLAFDPHLVGAASTASQSSRVTDSGAAATALASGIHTANNAIGVDPAGRACLTILEAAEARGLATGLVATSRLTHATPAAFASHVADRGEEDAIAVQMMERGVDVMLGGGERHFRPDGAGGGRRDGRDLVREAERRGATFVADRTALRAAASGKPPARGRTAGSLLGLFASSHLAYALDRDTLREPGLAEMTRAAIRRLSGDPDGFFLMVEGSRIDHAGHVNDPATAAREVLEFEAAFEAALAFARRDGRTLVVVTADHETGGLTLGREIQGRSHYEWRPEVLREAHASAAVLAGRIDRGERPEAVLAEAGVRDLSAFELSSLRSPGRLGREATIGRIVSERARIGWTTLGHTAVDVPVWAYGPGAASLRGSWPNDELGRRVAAALGLRIGVRIPGTLRVPAPRAGDD